MVLKKKIKLDILDFFMFISCKRILLLVCCTCLVVGFTMGQETEWPLSNSFSTTISLNYEQKKLPVTIEIKDFLLQNEKIYYRKNKENKSFKTDTDIVVYKDSKYKVRVYFNTSKFGGYENYQLKILGHGWITTSNCFKKTELKNSTYPYPIVINATGHYDLPINLKANCGKNKSSTMIFEFQVQENQKIIKFTQGSSKQENEKGKISFEVPIKVSKYSKAEYETQQANKTQQEEQQKQLQVWLETEIEKIKTKKGIGNTDPLKLVNPLKELEKQQNDRDKINIVKKEIEKIAQEHLETNVLKAKPCPNWVKEFGGTELFKELSDADKKRYQNHIDTCGKGGTIPDVEDDEDNEAWQFAKTRDMVGNYKAYLKKYPNGNHSEDAQNKISELKEYDKRAWEAAKKERKNSPCEWFDDINKYLNDKKHCLDYRQSVEKLRKEVEKLCKEPRIQLIESNITKGIYVFEIINAEPPFSSENEEITINGNEATVAILEDGKYNFKIQINNQIKLPLQFTASQPDFAYLKKNNQIIIKGGKPPFMFFDPSLNKQTSYEKRKIEIDEIINKLRVNLEKNSKLELMDIHQKNILYIDLGEGTFSWWKFILFLIAIFLSLFYFKDKISAFFTKKSEEDKHWEKAIGYNKWQFYEAYFEKYGKQGKYHQKFSEKKQEHNKFLSCTSPKDYKSHIEEYPESMHLGEATAAIQSKNQNNKDQSSATDQTSNVVSGIDFLDSPKEETTIGSKQNDHDIIANAVPTHINNTHYKFNLQTHWKNSRVQEIYMSRDAAITTDGLIIDAYRAAIKQKEAIPEVGGFMLGKIYEPRDKDYQVVVERFVSVTPESNGEYEVAFGKTAFMQLEKAMFETYKTEDLKVVGWMHTHPGHGLFLSGKDLEVVETHFKKPYHVSMEVETLTKNSDAAFFTRKHDDSLNNQKDRISENWFEWNDVVLWLKN